MVRIELTPGKGSAYMDPSEIRDRLDASLNVLGIRGRFAIEGDIYKMNGMPAEKRDEFLDYVKKVLPNIAVC